jgi:hypothetical protein
MTRGAPEPSQQIRSHGTPDGTGDLPSWEAGSGAKGHVAAPEPTSIKRQNLVL